MTRWNRTLTRLKIRCFTVIHRHVWSYASSSNDVKVRVGCGQVYLLSASKIFFEGQLLQPQGPELSLNKLRPLRRGGVAWDQRSAEQRLRWPCLTLHSVVSIESSRNSILSHMVWAVNNWIPVKRKSERVWAYAFPGAVHVLSLDPLCFRGLHRGFHVYFSKPYGSPLRF